MSHNTSENESFSNLGLNSQILGILERLKFTVPTPIQNKAIPVAAEGNDVIGIAQTGTGKTLAFSLPLLQQMSVTKKQGLIILPTRELAIQVDEQLAQIGQSFGLKRALLIGGASMQKQLSDLRRQPQIIIGTPGRIIDHLEQKSLKVNNVGILVLDEADRMLDMGFSDQINRIFESVPKDRQTMLFSATMPAEIVKIANKHMKMPVRIEVARAGTVAEKVDQELFVVQRYHKNRLLDKLLEEYKGTVLVFSRTKHGARKIARAIKDMGHSSAEIHSNLTQSQRKRSLEGFKSGKFRVLVATDIAARGIDVTNIELVINYDLPDNLDDYVHRVGRTGRAGKVGQAISFITPDQRGKIRLIERLVRTSLTVSPLPTLPEERPQRAQYEQEDRGSHSYGRGRDSRGRSNRRDHQKRGKGPFQKNRQNNRRGEKKVRVH